MEIFEPKIVFIPEFTLHVFFCPEFIFLQKNAFISWSHSYSLKRVFRDLNMEFSADVTFFLSL